MFQRSPGHISIPLTRAIHVFYLQACLPVQERIDTIGHAPDAKNAAVNIVAKGLFAFV